eukprot:RCo028885
MPSYIVSVPFNQSGSRNVQDQFNAVSSQLVSAPNPFEVPPLKVGTLDILLECSDDLMKIDTQVEGTTFKVLSILEDISGSQDVAAVNEPSGGTTITKRTEEYLSNFKWNEAQYPINKPLKQLIQSITENVAKGEENIRTRLSDYNDVKQKLASVKKKSTGTLAVKPIANIVKQWYQQNGEEGPVESEYLTTLFVAVPIQQEKQWLKDYATLGSTEFVVPESSKLICKESDYCLYNVILFRKVLDTYKNHCRENKYLAREYAPNEEVTDAELEELNEQADTKKNNLVRWLKNTFSECYIAYIHLKAIRVFVESILKYGLPPNFVAMHFQVDAKKDKEVRKQLGTLYAHLSPKKFGGAEEGDTVNSLELQYPYVSLRVRASATD